MGANQNRIGMQNSRNFSATQSQSYQPGGLATPNSADLRDNQDYKQYLKEHASGAAYKLKNVLGMFGAGKDGNSSSSGGDRLPGAVGHSDSP